MAAAGPNLHKQQAQMAATDAAGSASNPTAATTKNATAAAAPNPVPATRNNPTAATPNPIPATAKSPTAAAPNPVPAPAKVSTPGVAATSAAAAQPLARATAAATLAANPTTLTITTTTRGAATTTASVAVLLSDAPPGSVAAGVNATTAATDRARSNVGPGATLTPAAASSAVPLKNAASAGVGDGKGHATDMPAPVAKFAPAVKLTSSLRPLERLAILSGGVQGVVFEVLPRLSAAFSEAEMHHVAEHLFDLLGDHYLSPACGTALWVVYKRLFGQDPKAMMAGIDTKEKQAAVRAWLRDPAKGGLYFRA